MGKSNSRNISDGDVFGNYTVVSAYFEKRYGKWHHRCQCSCGVVKAVQGGHLRSGASTSCGCVRNELISRSKTRHGGVGTRTYQIWKGMKNRCFNQNDIAYPRYGGAGISVCDRWANDYQAFFDDMGECPDGLTLDRIDGALGYCKENCRWATDKQQAENRSTRNGSTGVKGVRKHGNKFRVDICHNYKQIYIGLFDSLDEAIRARRAAEIKYWGSNNAASPN
ncbi:hypothetical protein GCM10011348_46090 [Marinobacterium nitratireducens]|uniref:AP2/ERF domain-containing protein n=1 Tax=Marinobacterium nitratireducens TaxID=518897 RepID=A0A917ZRE6_9GAMM|nr:AP2 domain-containing protein [Marinobacterium nitratireducens]GGO89109.1 hypothetical protein GCM10011348_46090 [Marinobacterium nitratireducens]